ncbi:MAG: Maf family protein [Patescibacteria group bacterium]|nr:Maf family protein [Patescibacteria group bacterium]
MKKIILASGSPRRKEILENIGLEFDVVESDYKEDMTLKLPPKELAKFLSRGKAEDVVKNHSNNIIIAADTFIVCNDEILGKPHTAEVAKETLNKISNQTLDVITGYTIIGDSIEYSIESPISKTITTQVIVKEMTDAEIDAYVATSEPLDKAGAFGIQGHGALLVKEIHGDYYNVMGLPLFDLMESLKKFNVKIL